MTTFFLFDTAGRWAICQGKWLGFSWNICQNCTECQWALLWNRYTLFYMSCKLFKSRIFFTMLMKASLFAGKKLAKASPSRPTGIKLHSRSQQNSRRMFCCSWWCQYATFFCASNLSFQFKSSIDSLIWFFFFFLLFPEAKNICLYDYGSSVFKDIMVQEGGETN